jgi:AraC-like DNA-binding protein
MIRVPFVVIPDAPLGALTTNSIASRHLLALVDAAGVSCADLFAAAGVAADDVATPDFALPLEAFAQLWARAAALQPDIGLALVERFPPGQMHVLAHLAMRSPDVRRAFEDVCRYATVTSAADELRLAEGGGVARFTYACRAGAPANPWMAEHYLAMASVFLARATGRALPIRSVSFSAPAQAPLAAYVARFGLAPRFGAAANCLEFDAAALAWPLLTHDDYLHAILEAVARARHVAPANAPLDDARREITRALLAGATPTMGAVAAACGLGTRALRERLAREGASFRQLLDDSRRDLAREYLGHGLSVTETAYLLGFSEPAALQHACLRWFDQPAGKVRKLLANP